MPHAVFRHRPAHLFTPGRLPLACALALAGWVALPVAAQGTAPAAMPAAASASASAAAAAASSASAPALQASPRLNPPPDGDAARQRPLIVQAERLTVRPDIDAVAEGAVEFRRAGMLIRADRLAYDSATDTANARGKVEIEQPGVRYRGSELQLQLQRFEGFFQQPEFELLTLGAGGRAERIEFLDSTRSRAHKAIYTSCPRDDGQGPDWLLRTDRVRFDLQANEGIAEGAVLEFLGLPILALPVVSFPLSDDRKSGWLPPTIVPVDSRNGTTLAVPYYWNIAPNRDATLTPTLLARRGMALGAEFRYLEPGHSGQIGLHLLPHDRDTGGSRHALRLEQQGRVAGLRFAVLGYKVSDDAYWKDFSQTVPGNSPRLLPQDVRAEQQFGTRWGALTAYARLQHWQVLQTGSGDDLIVAPYRRSPQLGLRAAPLLPLGLRASLETELNRFDRPDASASATLPTGWRWHALGSLSRPFTEPGWWFTPKLSLNAASYHIDQTDAAQRRRSRLIPTTSLDTGMVFERNSRWFGRAQRQTLEPRLLYVNTPYREQSQLPLFDTAERDFNAVSIYAENAFSGVDRVSDAHQITTGVTSRMVDAQTGAETLRLGIAQRIRLRDQRVVLSGESQTQRFSDLLVDGSTAVFNPWRLDVALQYNPDSSRVVRSILGARYSPAPFHTLSMGYRLARNLSEQAELGWQWPIYRGSARPVGASGGCGGTVYGVGRLNYSLRDSRLTDSIVGLEYDSACWIGRLVLTRLSTGRAEARTQLSVQLELSGLSRIGTNPLQLLKDNVPGYRLLRDTPGQSSPRLDP
ncbi:LPS-assembly protein LptD [Aquabacterium sp. OR-4]|uniref:LPS-assembly protein LptD n=1 Tax=Aquabacterium sp. OR-4 TaxID=2978127 RepID=UPI0021B26DF9|nr:LPS assembly protein LptD [Aquabacterium sp. OR-4]MDT7833869.1 LPS assembly protein LptD [Aquabacterium sp. OR-4]